MIYILLDNASKYAPPGTTITVRAAREDDRQRSDLGRRRRARASPSTCASGCSRSFSASPGASRTIRIAAASGSVCRLPAGWSKRRAADLDRCAVGRPRHARRDDLAGRRRDRAETDRRGTKARDRSRHSKGQHDGNSRTEKSRVLVVDDEPQITRVLRTVLSSQGYQVRTASEGEAALSNFAEFRPELVITDLYMPHMDGVELCKRIRAMSTVPIIVLSVKGEERTKVEALDSGADDYVTKPFGIDELLARVRAALRRSGGDTEMASFEAGEFRVDLDGRRVHARGNEVRLTPKEFELFVYMARHPNRVITHRTLLEAVWGEASQEQPEYLRVFMGQLRKKLEPDPSNPRFLVTEPWVGYRFNPNG